MRTTLLSFAIDNPFLFFNFSLKSLKQRLQDSSEITINFELGTISVKAKPPAVKCRTQPLPSGLSDTGSQPALQSSGPGGSTISGPAGPSATTTSDVAMENCEKPGTEIASDSTVVHKANEDVEKAEVKGEEGSLTTSISTADVTSTSAVPAASSPAPSATSVMPEENFTELPQINADIFKALTAAVRQHRLTRGGRPQSEEKEVRPGFKSHSTFSFKSSIKSSFQCVVLQNNFSGYLESVNIYAIIFFSETYFFGIVNKAITQV